MLDEIARLLGAGRERLRTWGLRAGVVPYRPELNSIRHWEHAYETGTSRLTYRAGSSLLSGPGPKSETGKYVVIFKRVKGEWKIAYDIFNND